MADPRTDGTEQEPATHEEMDGDRHLKDAKEGIPTLKKIGKAALAKHITKRWDRLEDVARQRLAEIKVNYLRYNGHPFVQIHPRDPNRVYMPPGATTRSAPTINKIKRTTHRYVAQVTADEPVMEAVPDSHRDEARDAAEAATAALRGEWHRLKLNPKLQRAMHFSAIMRSSFWFFQWDDMAGGTEPAMKFFEVENGEQTLLPVDSSGNPVDNPADAAKIRVGDLSVEVMTPANVRWSNGQYAHEADEVMVTKMLTLRQLYSQIPKTRKVKLEELMPKGSHAPTSGIEWLEDFRATTPRGKKRDFKDDQLTQTGNDVPDTDEILDEHVRVIHYFMKPCRDYPKGLYSIVVGNHVAHRGILRYGMIPVAHFKFLDEVADPLGFGLVDMLKDPQELLDFVNGQILRYLQMLKRRWFVPLHSGVKTRDLMSPTRSIIEFNPQAGAPIPETQPEIPNSLVNWVDRFDAEYDDQSGIHDTLQGKHVPGVSSGRHAEALRSGDETLLGLTREQMKIGLERGAEIMLSIIKKEWTTERRVRFLGKDRQYIEQAFMGTDFAGTGTVVLKNSTLLMLTPAQRLDTILTMAEAQAISPDEVRRLAPLGDVMGISLSEDVHYQRARRQNSRFLAGPPDDLVDARQEYEDKIEAVMVQQTQLQQLAQLGGDPEIVQQSSAAIEEDMMAIEEDWRMVMEKYAFAHRNWEDRTDIARIHAEVHADGLAQEKVERFPEWWLEMFEAHTRLEWELGFPQQVMEQAQVEQATAPPQPAQPQGIDADAIETAPVGMEFNDQTPHVVSGMAP